MEPVVSIWRKADIRGRGRAPFSAADFIPGARMVPGQLCLPPFPCGAALQQCTSLVTSYTWRQWSLLCMLGSQGGGRAPRLCRAPLIVRPLHGGEHAAALTCRSIAFGGGGSRGGKPSRRKPHRCPLPPQQSTPQLPPLLCLPLPSPPPPPFATPSIRYWEQLATD